MISLLGVKVSCSYGTDIFHQKFYFIYILYLSLNDNDRFEISIKIQQLDIFHLILGLIINI